MRDAPAPAALHAEVEKSMAGAKLAVQGIGVASIALYACLDARIRSSCQGAVVLGVLVLIVLIALSSPRWPIASRVAAPAFMLVETWVFLTESAALGPQGLAWSVPIVATIIVTASLFCSRFHEYLIASVTSWAVLFFVGRDLHFSPSEWHLLLTFSLSVTAVGAVMQRRFSSMVHRLIVAKTQFETLANTDALTGLANRRHFLHLLEDALAHEPVVVLMADIDHFKKINDQYGHPAGDAVIQAVSEQLRRLEGCLACGRLGGEEFAAILSVPLHRVADVLKPLRAALQTETLPVTVSVGAILPHADESVSQVLGRADIQLYQAKEQGRDRVSVDGTVTSLAMLEIRVDAPCQQNRHTYPAPS